MTPTALAFASFLASGCTAVRDALPPSRMELPVIETAEVFVPLGESGELYLPDAMAAVEYADGSFTDHATLRVTALGDADAPFFLVEVEGAAMDVGIGLLRGWTEEQVESSSGALAAPLAFVHRLTGEIEPAELRMFDTSGADPDQRASSGWVVSCAGLVQLVQYEPDATVSARLDVVSSTTRGGAIDAARGAFTVEWEIDSRWSEQTDLELPASDLAMRIEDVAFSGVTPVYGDIYEGSFADALFEGGAVVAGSEAAWFTTPSLFAGNDNGATVSLEADGECGRSGDGYVTLTHGIAIAGSLDDLPAAELVRWEGGVPEDGSLRVTEPDADAHLTFGETDDVVLAWTEESRTPIECR